MDHSDTPFPSWLRNLVPHDVDQSYVMPIVMYQTPLSTHEDTLVAAARAIPLLLSDPAASDEWQQPLQQWSAHQMRKVVRRAKGSGWNKVGAIPGVTSVSGSTPVRAFIPHPVSESPHRDIARAQVRLDLPRDTKSLPEPIDGALLVALNPHVDMSTGKAAAQVAHIAHMAARLLSAEDTWRWADAGFNVNLVPWEEVVNHEHLSVEDAGFTEVPPGTVTAAGRLA